MGVANYLKPGLSDRTRVKIMTVDPSTRRVEGMLKDGSMIQIAVWDVPNAFRWPMETEIWIVRRDNGIWMLDRRVQGSTVSGAGPDIQVTAEVAPIENMTPGEMKLDAGTIIDANGNVVMHSGTPAGGDLTGTYPSPAINASLLNPPWAPRGGAVHIATAQSTSSTTYTTLATPDQVTGIVLPPNGLIRVWYQATWQESVGSGARAALFIGANQLKVAQDTSTAPLAEAAAIFSAGGVNSSLFSTSFGLAGGLTGAYSGDVATGQAVGFVNNAVAKVGVDLGGFGFNLAASAGWGGGCDVFAVAGTYTISVQFKAASGSVTASNRRLWAQALGFA